MEKKKSDSMFILEISKKVMSSLQMGRTWCRLKLAQGMNHKGDVGFSDSEV